MLGRGRIWQCQWRCCGGDSDGGRVRDSDGGRVRDIGRCGTRCAVEDYQPCVNEKRCGASFSRVHACVVEWIDLATAGQEFSLLLLPTKKKYQCSAARIDCNTNVSVKTKP